jgi:uncharacterized DUF497 family protein
MKVRFEWDPVKAATNRRKHKVSFEIAIRVFSDPLALTRQDQIEGGEQRWTTIGLVDGQVLLIVAHTAWEDGDLDVVRIISARRAEPKETRRYEQSNR